MNFFFFYPIGLDLHRQRSPVLTYAMILLMGVVFLWSRYFPDHFGLSPLDLAFFPGNGAPWTAVTAILLHGDWWHYLGNMVYLFVFGPALEEKLGPGRTLWYLLFCGVGGNLVHGVVTTQEWIGESGVGVLGASGALAGLLGFAMVRLYYARVAVAYWVLAPLGGHNRAGKAYLPVPAAITLWILLQFVYTMVAAESDADVAYGAHLGGLGVGLFLAIALGYLQEARAEAHLVIGQRYLEQGASLAAAGEFGAYLERDPDSFTGRIQLARAYRMAGQARRAQDAYLQAFRRCGRIGRLDRAAAVYREARLGAAAADFAAKDLFQAGFYLEKQFDYTGAVQVYADLVNCYPDHERVDYALVRLVVLCSGRCRDDEKAQHWLAVAADHLPVGAWRDFLAGEFGLTVGQVNSR